MTIGRRLYDLLRANALHYLRGEDPGPSTRPWPAGDRPGPGPADPGAGTDPGDRWGPRSPRPEHPARLRKAYRALELDYGAGSDAVRHAHRRLMRRYHPDRFAQDPARLADATRVAQQLTEARDLLLEALERGEVL